jgi:hypothetical protein
LRQPAALLEVFDQRRNLVGVFGVLQQAAREFLLRVLAPREQA